ncbi:chitin disaccharide deacetylase [Photobacterium nomapromontoriensis]|uniref:chitin disaccharide deacetylase n=1 Tax=Photobacterium nomapromontoriensis TaxID=2910237 RepID=UPI003D095C3A
MHIIFNADDFGLTSGVNLGIVEACQSGVVRSTTLMVGMKAEQHAIALASTTPQLKVGLHLRFTAGTPLTQGAKSLVDENGRFLDKSVLAQKKTFCQQQIANEAVAQIEAFRSHGIHLSHIDSHHHAHTHPKILPVIQDIARDYQVPLRGTGYSDIRATHCRYHFTDRFYGSELSVDGLLALISQHHGDVDVLEVMCHPANVDTSLIAMSGYSRERAKELAILTDPYLQEQLDQLGVVIGDYSVLSSSA